MPNDPHQTLNTNKADLRRFAKAFRQALPVAGISRQICDRLKTWPHYQQAVTILAFQALPHEVDLQPLFEDPHKTWLLPRVEGKGNGQQLRFLHYRKGDTLEKSRFGVEEPMAGQPALAADETVDLILMPGLMFDLNGNRLGYGMSFYDRFLAARFPQQKPLLVGVAADALVVPKLPSDPWDIPTDWVITEENAYPTAKR